MINDGSNHNFIGGSSLKERNVISDADGICIILSSNSRNNFIAGNYIGMDLSGKTILQCMGGIQLSQSDGNVIQGNRIAGATSAGISLEGADFNLLRANQLIQNFNGLNLKDSNRNLIKDNIVTESKKIGIGIEGSSDNLFYNNAFVKNTSDCYGKGNNMWDSGKLGNFWDKYSGTDGNGDGIGDTPYSNDSIFDSFPLMQKPSLSNFG
jgi:parallel beta-helix repeat protein